MLNEIKELERLCGGLSPAAKTLGYSMRQYRRIRNQKTDLPKSTQHLIRRTVSLMKILRGGAMKYDLKELERAAIKACEMAEAARESFDDPVNWGDFGVVTAEYYQDSDGCDGYRVNVEEASPEAYDVQLFIGEELASLGFEDIKVITEW